MSIKDSIARALSGDEAPAPDALALIKSDHEEVSALFKVALDDEKPAAQRRGAIAKIVQALTVHAEMEEALFYPALRKAGGADERDSVLEAAEEHACVKDLIEKIKASTGRDETLKAKVTVLKELVEHHVKEEESEIFSEARKALGSERLETLGAEMQRFKDRYGKARGRAAATAERKAVRGTPSAKKSTARKAPARKAAGGKRKRAA